MSKLKPSLWTLALVVFAIFPLIVTNPTFTTIAVFTLLFMACTTSWNMFSGYSGYVSLGSAIFYGCGAYTMALVSTHAHMAGGEAQFWLVPLAGLVAMVVAIPVGAVALRVRRHTFVVITIALFFVFQLLAINFSFTGGAAGISLPLIPWLFNYYNLPFYYVALGLVIFATLLSAGVRRSRFGLQLLAIRDDEDRALGLGVRVTAVKLTGFTMSAFTIGMAGALYAMFIGQIYPQFVFDPTFDITVALMAFFGGFGTLLGPLLGGLILESSQQYLTLTFTNGSLYLILFGVLFLLVILFMPQGIVVRVSQLWAQRNRRRETPLTPDAVAAMGVGH
ncbi:MAG TPA: branched-chain amino acid ABC transporter permease [Acidimicrobiales bacterium]|nr:branched-chain amino acid ABC transporter permease [Acidimicrobiales bacterium]